MRDFLPFAWGRLGLLTLLAAVAAHLWAATLGPDARGFLFHAGPVVEAFAQSALLVAPLLAIYAGLRGAYRDRRDALAYLAVSGGSLLGALTIVGLAAAFLAA